MANLNDLLRNFKAEKLVGNEEKLGHLMDAPETQQIFRMLEQSTGGSLQQAAENAAKGDTAQLVNAIQQLMGSTEGSKLVQQMRSKLK